jgi:chaperonin GroES
MLNLSRHIKLSLEVLKSPNLCDRFSDEDLNAIGQLCLARYKRDVQSRERWVQRSEAAIDLAMQVQEDKTFPWAGCSNVIFPLVTIAALQFHARAYPVIIQGDNVVKCRNVGNDPTGNAAVRANLISRHMSWQVLEEDEEWEEETDRGLLNVSIVGCGFKKTYYSSERGHNVSCFVQAKDLVFDYWAKSVETCRTKSHRIQLYHNDIYSGVQSGKYRDVLDEGWYKAGAAIPVDPIKAAQDRRDGIEPPMTNDEDAPFSFLEQHCWLDLDGDGYEEPYIVTLEETSGHVLRIVTRFDREEDIERNTSDKIIRITPWEYFTKIPFIPSPDGSIMDIGFGVFLGPLNESVNSAINQLFDAGTMANTAGGFLGRGAKIRGGVYEFNPFQWQRVDSTGDDLRKNIFPLPVREPSDVMFKLLGLIIDYTNRISATTELNVGENVGQNTPAETARTMSENGQRIYTAIFKRIWRSMRKEFQKLYQLNSVFLPTKTIFGADGSSVGREDYRGSAAQIVPFADPSVSSAGERYARAAAVKQLSMGNPAYDPDAVELDVLRSLGVTDPERLYKGVENAPPPPPDVKIQLQQMKNELAMAQLQVQQAQIMGTLQLQQRMNEAQIAKIQAEIVKLYEEGKAVTEKQRIDAFRASMELIREQNKGLGDQLKSLMEIGKNELESRGVGSAAGGLESSPGNAGGVPALAGPDTGAGGPMA